MALPSSTSDREREKFEEIGGEVAVRVNGLGGGFISEEYDEMVLAYTASVLDSVVYKLASVTVATLTMSYTGADLTGIVKS